MIQIEDETWLSTAELVDTLNISRSTLFSLRRSGDAPKNVKLGRRLYFNQQELVTWIHDHEESA